MQRIHFTGTDLARVRLRSSLGSLLEGVFATRLLVRPAHGDVYARWRIAVRNSIRGSSRAALPVAPAPGFETPLLRLLEAAGRDRGVPAQRTEADRLALDVWRAGVLPYAERMLERLEAVCHAHCREAAAGGVEGLLSTLHPRISWRGPVLEVAGGPDRDVHLDGRGLVLKPSVFLPGEAGRVLVRERESGQTVLVFAADPELTGGWNEVVPAAGTDDGDEDGEVRALSALVGQTRAAALRVLTDTSTNSELAARLGVSPGVASRHAAVLRETGLITTRRVGSSALHTVTPLGMALLGGQPLNVLSFTAARDARGGAGAGSGGPRASRSGGGRGGAGVGAGRGMAVPRAFRTA
ncbi:ArsR/SmtB family transcription factor [Streptomyces sp. NPDC093795]|uniref:ArsR/SmtB family transcription factor n=1 Tax=Streptomyces sp. NPDC093795 TaxID=3366051 RepID=UPI0038184ED5